MEITRKRHTECMKAYRRVHGGNKDNGRQVCIVHTWEAGQARKRIRDRGDQNLRWNTVPLRSMTGGQGVMASTRVCRRKPRMP